MEPILYKFLKWNNINIIFRLNAKFGVPHFYNYAPFFLRTIYKFYTACPRENTLVLSSRCFPSP